MVKQTLTRASDHPHTLFVTALANFLNGVGSCGLHNTEEYSRNISMPKVTLERYLLSAFAEAGRGDIATYRRLLFL